MTKNKKQTNKGRTGNKQDIRENFDKSIRDDVKSGEESTGSTGPRSRNDKKK